MGAHGQFTAFERVSIAAAGLRHSRAPFPPERDCAESQSQRPTKEDFVFIAQGTATGASALARRGKVFLPLPKGEGRGEGKVHSIFTRVAVPTLRFPSPLIPLPRGEGNK